MKAHLDSQITVATYHGPNRNDDAAFLSSFRIVITTYSTLASDFAKKNAQNKVGGGGLPNVCRSVSVGSSFCLMFAISFFFFLLCFAIGPNPNLASTFHHHRHHQGLHQLTWKRVVLDEGHYIKNRNTGQAKAAFGPQPRASWCSIHKASAVPA